MHIVQLTSAHPRTDARVFHKQCCSLAEAGAKVTLVVADGLGDETKNGVEIRDVGRSDGRVGRMALSSKRVYSLAKTLEADLYHLHDPELIPWGLMLSRSKVPVVFDAHEDLPAQIATKHYLPKPARSILAGVASLGERLAFPKFSGLIGATPEITGKLRSHHRTTQLIANYPKRDEFAPPQERDPRFALFVGSMSRIRGIAELADAMQHTNANHKLHLVGPMANDGIAERVASSAGSERIVTFGSVSREAVAQQMRGAACGIVTFLEAPNHLNAQPNKLFEYMSAGIPVVASHFPLWRELIEGANCGLCVDPANPRAIAEAIDWVFDNPEEAAQMGRRGRAAIEEGLNWETQAEELLAFYGRLGAES